MPLAARRDRELASRISDQLNPIFRGGSLSHHRNWSTPADSNAAIRGLRTANLDQNIVR
jgi:hypothetical protein